LPVPPRTSAVFFPRALCVSIFFSFSRLYTVSVDTT
jgi:hypothetical protein